MIDTADGIAFYKLLVMRGAARLEAKGLQHSSRRSVAKLAHSYYGLKCSVRNKTAIAEELSALVERCQAAKQARQPLCPDLLPWPPGHGPR